MIKFFWCPQTRSSRILWMLNELGQPFERILTDIRTDRSSFDPEFAVASPMGKVPAIADGEVRMADSAAIGLYLADRYPAAGLAPAISDDDRGQYLYWMVFTPGVIEPAMSERVSGHEPKPQTNGWGSFDSMLATLRKGIADGPWLLGDDFSAADVMVGSSVCFMKMFNMLPTDPLIDAYADRCMQREAYQRAMAAESGD